MYNAVGCEISRALIGMHAFTWCDTVSALAGHGKLTTLKQTKSKKIFQEAFTELGQTWEVLPELHRKLQTVTCQIYLPSATTNGVNKLRYHLFCARK